MSLLKKHGKKSSQETSAILRDSPSTPGASRRKSASFEPPERPKSQQSVKSGGGGAAGAAKKKIIPAFLSNLFGNANKIVEKDSPLEETPPSPPAFSGGDHSTPSSPPKSSKPPTKLSSAQSHESINSVLSSSSFSYVKDPTAAGGKKKVKGKRIPVDDPNYGMISSSTKNNNSGDTKTEGNDSVGGDGDKGGKKQSGEGGGLSGTLDRIGMRIGLKMKYNLQSCESLQYIDACDEPTLPPPPKTPPTSKPSKNAAASSEPSKKSASVLEDKQVVNKNDKPSTSTSITASVTTTTSTVVPPPSPPTPPPQVPDLIPASAPVVAKEVSKEVPPPPPVPVIKKVPESKSFSSSSAQTQIVATSACKQQVPAPKQEEPAIKGPTVKENTIKEPAIKEPVVKPVAKDQPKPSTSAAAKLLNSTPPPPPQVLSLIPSSSSNTGTWSNSGRRKRRAPPPPSTSTELNPATPSTSSAILKKSPAPSAPPFEIRPRKKDKSLEPLVPPPPTVISIQRPATASFADSGTSITGTLFASHRRERYHKRSCSEGQQVAVAPVPSTTSAIPSTSANYNTGTRGRVHKPGKKKAPAPPNPFGDPDEDTTEEIQLPPPPPLEEESEVTITSSPLPPPPVIPEEPTTSSGNPFEDPTPSEPPVQNLPPPPQVEPEVVDLPPLPPSPPPTLVDMTTSPLDDVLEEIRQNMLNDQQERLINQQSSTSSSSPPTPPEITSAPVIQEPPNPPSSPAPTSTQRPTSTISTASATSSAASAPVPIPTETDIISAQHSLQLLSTVASTSTSSTSATPPAVAADPSTKQKLIELKREAEKSPLNFLKSSPKTSRPSSSGSSIYESILGVRSAGDSSPSTSQNGTEKDHPPQKIPWYKRGASSALPRQLLPSKLIKQSTSSSSSSTNSATGGVTSSTSPHQIVKPFSSLVKFSELDKEASRIVEENRRKSAEQRLLENEQQLLELFSDDHQGLLEELTAAAAAAESAAAAAATTSTTPAPLTSPPPPPILTTAAQVHHHTNSQRDPSPPPPPLPTTPPPPLDDDDPPVAASPTPSTSAGSSSPTFQSVHAASKHVRKIKPLLTSSSPITHLRSEKLAIVQPQPPNTTASTVTPSTTTPPATTSPSTTTSISTSSSSPLTSEWDCPRCTLKNPSWRILCEICFQRKDSPPGGTTSSSIPSSSYISSILQRVNAEASSNKASGNAPSITNRLSWTSSTSQSTSTSSSQPTTSSPPKLSTTIASSKKSTSTTTSSSKSTNQCIPSTVEDFQSQSTSSSSSTSNPPPIPSTSNDNLLSQLPTKKESTKTLPSSTPISSSPSGGDPPLEELDISKLRSARLAYFQNHQPHHHHQKDNKNLENIYSSPNDFLEEKPINHMPASTSTTSSSSTDKPNDLGCCSVTKKSPKPHQTKPSTTPTAFSDDDDDFIDNILFQLRSSSSSSPPPPPTTAPPVPSLPHLIPSVIPQKIPSSSSQSPSPIQNLLRNPPRKLEVIREANSQDYTYCCYSPTEIAQIYENWQLSGPTQSAISSSSSAAAAGILVDHQPSNTTANNRLLLQHDNVNLNVNIAPEQEHLQNLQHFGANGPPTQQAIPMLFLQRPILQHNFFTPENCYENNNFAGMSGSGSGRNFSGGMIRGRGPEDCWTSSESTSTTDSSSGGGGGGAMPYFGGFFGGMGQAPSQGPSQSSSSSAGITRRGTLLEGKDSSAYQNGLSPMDHQTAAVGKLMKRLEAAIANGDHKLAATLAHDMALMKVNCVVAKINQPFSIRVYVEDRFMQQGPFQVQVSSLMTVADLKNKMEKDWGIPAPFQKWILGRQMAESDAQSLSSFDISQDSMAFLFLVTPELKSVGEKQSSSSKMKSLDKHTRQTSISPSPQLQQQPTYNNITTPAATPPSSRKSIQNESPSPAPQKKKRTPVASSIKESTPPPPPLPCRSPIPSSSSSPSKSKKQLNTSTTQDPIAVSTSALSSLQQKLSEFKLVAEQTLGKTSSPSGLPPTPSSSTKPPTAAPRKEMTPPINPNVTTKAPSPARRTQASPQKKALRQQTPSPLASKSNSKEKLTTEKMEETPPNSQKPVKAASTKVEAATENRFNGILLPAMPQDEESIKPPERSLRKEGTKSPSPLPPVESSTSPAPQPKPRGIKKQTTVEKISQGTESPTIIVPASELATTVSSPPQSPPPPPTTEVPPISSPTPEEPLKQETTTVEQQPIQSPVLPPSQDDFCQTTLPFPAPKPRSSFFTSGLGTSESAGRPLENNNETRPLLRPSAFVSQFQKASTSGTPSPSSTSYTGSGIAIAHVHPLQVQPTPSSHVSLPPSTSPALPTQPPPSTEDKQPNNKDDDETQDKRKEEVTVDKPKSEPTYLEMVEMMEKQDLICSTEPAECPICFSSVPQGEGVVLRDCLHAFCRECLVGCVQYADDSTVKCPFRDNSYTCNSNLQEREIKALVPTDIFEKYLARSVKLAESKIVNTFHCKTPDCTGWCVFEDDVNVFVCPVCKKRNCLTCAAIHEGIDCQRFQREMAIAAETDEDAKQSRLMLEKMIQRGEALDCPACHVVLLKKWGCDWVRCSYCKTEICWVTKGPRWGPAGKGDLSGGCKCGVNGVKCHPKCTYCH